MSPLKTLVVKKTLSWGAKEAFHRAPPWFRTTERTPRRRIWQKRFHRRPSLLHRYWPRQDFDPGILLQALMEPRVVSRAIYWGLSRYAGRSPLYAGRYDLSTASLINGLLR